MAIKISDIELDEKLSAYMAIGGEQAFPLDENRVFGDAAPKRNIWVIKKTQVAAAILLILALSVLAIPQVSAALIRLFTFIPGIGIVESGDISYYAMKPIVRKIENSDESVYAVLDNAVYDSGRLGIHVTMNGRYAGEHGEDAEMRMDSYADGFSLFINGVEVDFQNASWAKPGTFTTGLDMWIDIDTPDGDDLFEIGINGFEQMLSFTLARCKDYSDLSEIGPTAVHNGISVTTTAYRSGNQLTVRYYTTKTTEDLLSGDPMTWKNEAYIVLGSGVVSYDIVSDPGANVSFDFEIPADEGSATLHIPYLTLMRHEQKKITVPVPKEHSSIACDISVGFSLGNARVTNVERIAATEGEIMETLRIFFEFDSNAGNVVFSSVADANFDWPRGWARPSSSIYWDVTPPPILTRITSKYNDETSILDYIDIGFVETGGPTESLSFTTNYIYYFLTDEYVIPLDILD